MKFSKNVLLGLVGAVAADWSDAPVDGASTTSGWGAPSSTPVAATSTSPTWVGPAGTTTVVTTITRTHTVKVATCACPASTTLAGGQGWNGAGSGSQGGSGGQGSYSSLDAGISGNIDGTGAQVWTWTSPTGAAPTSNQPAPTYSGWGDAPGPSPGASNSNVTQPFPPLQDGQCPDNTPWDRSQWCGYSTSTDWYNNGPNTGKVCAYNWVITNTTLNYDGVDRLALAINGQVPGPLIECNWGDTIQVTVTNQMQDNATSVHWHGMWQRATNDQDGVPGITECALAPGDTRTYTFKAEQYGTGWYHSHALTQLGDGVRGPMVIHGPATANYDIDAGTVMIDDLFGNGTQVVSAGTQDARIAHFGPAGTWNYMLNGHNTFPDLSRGKHALWEVESGKKYRFRFINSASQNMWALHMDNHKMTVMAVDYVPIVPYETEWLNIGIGQRYDVVIEMNQPSKGYFLRAVNQIGCPSGSANNGLGSANGIVQYKGAPLVLPTSSFGNKTVNDFNYCLDEPIASLVPFLKKSGGTLSSFQSSASLMPAGNVARVSTSDDGNVFRWFLNNGAIKVDYEQPTLLSIAEGHVNNKSISNPVILQKQGAWYYFIIQNQFFASHPMHLHGHDFSVLGQGQTAWNPSLLTTLNFENPLRRDTAMLTGSAGPGSPPGYTVIGFQADNPGAWLMHCHIVWHVDGGLAMQFTELPKQITAQEYVSKPSFQNECRNVKNYFANGGEAISSGVSGLKVRSYMDDMLNLRTDNVVRRGDSVGRRYIDQKVSRSNHF